MKLELLNNLLRDYGCQASSAREAFLSLVLTGVPCPALDQYLSQSSSEPQRHNTFRLSKAVDEKCAGLEALLRERVGRVAEAVVFRASKLRGLARVGDEFQVGRFVGGCVDGWTDGRSIDGRAPPILC